MLHRLSPQHLHKLQSLHEQVNANLPSGFLRVKSTDAMLSYLEGRAGAAFGVFENESLIAAGLVRVPVEAGSIRPLPLIPREDWPHATAVLEHAMVAPTARGRGLHRRLLEARCLHARDAGMRWLGGGANVNNIASWRNLLASGFAIVGIRVHVGHTLFGLLRSLDGVALSSSVAHRRLVHVRDTDEHLRALDDGYIGVRWIAAGFIVYQLTVNAHGKR